MRRSTCTLVVLTALLVAPAALGQYSEPEFRSMWVTRIEWPSGGQSTIQARLNSIMQDLADHGFNAVFFQVRGQADVLYPSPYEPWSPLINGGVDPGWDPLAYAINAAHSRGIEFHAYINTHTCWQSGAHLPPASPSHLFFAHCNAAASDKRDWLIHDSGGNPVQWSENNYVWLAPGVPEYQAYIRKQILYVVQNYDVDGVHFDRIRTPNSNYSYDPISLARLNSPQSNPNSLSFHPWTADQITRNVRDIYAAVMAVKPNVRVSAAVYPNPATSPANQHQDSLTWLAAGALDTAVPMMYSSGGAGSTWDSYLQAWMAGRAGRHIVAGQNTGVGLAMLLQQIELTRARGAHGNAVYSWGSFTFWDEYLANVYQVDVAPPTMTWKTATGIISGYVKTVSGTPVVDVQVTRTGSTYTALSTGDGFYSLLLVPPGTYTLTASHPGYGIVTQPQVVVSGGAVTNVDLTLGPGLPPIIAEVAPDPDSAVVGSLYSRQLVLTQGTADSFTVLQPANAEVSPGGLVAWQPDPGEAGTTVTFTVRATNTAGSDDETWQVSVSHPPACTIFRLADFENYDAGASVLFRRPRFSGSTSVDLAASPDIGRVTTAAAFKGNKSHEVQWQWLDTTPQRWMRLTTYESPAVPNPTVDLQRPIRVRLRLDSGQFRLCLGLRETNSTAELGGNGGTSGTIEWVGAASDVDGAPQGVLVQAQPGVWQTFTFDPLTDPIHGLDGDGILTSTTGKVVFEHLAFSVTNTFGPITVYLDDIDQLCGSSPYGDFNNDGWVDPTDLSLFTACRLGPAIIQTSPGCTGMDTDSDRDLDLDDFGRFQRCYDSTGPQLNPLCAE